MPFGSRGTKVFVTRFRSGCERPTKLRDTLGFLYIEVPASVGAAKAFDEMLAVLDDAHVELLALAEHRKIADLIVEHNLVLLDRAAIDLACEDKQVVVVLELGTYPSLEFFHSHCSSSEARRSSSSSNVKSIRCEA